MTTDDRISPRLTAAQRLAMVLGRPAPEPLNADELAALEAAQDQADTEAERVWGVRGRAAA
ncbi:hypothetical protein [Krasilnikovia sp. M28-CT-15]|uniref:hypothetical protein n=1 Tax=Krasilnikovia sp. M28-CT-15 TaxID=3373540 RepID=UPI0038767A27